MYDYDRTTAANPLHRIAFTIRLGRIQKRDIQKVLDSADVDFSEFSHDGGGFKGKGWEIYWDDQDSSNKGWAYRSKGDSGELDSRQDVEKVVRKLAKSYLSTPEAIQDRIEQVNSKTASGNKAAMSDVARKVQTARKAADDLAKYWSGSPQSERLLDDAVTYLTKAEGSLTRAISKLA